MKLLSVTTEERTIRIGRTRADRQVTTETVWIVETDHGTFQFDHQPTDQEVIDSIPKLADMLPEKRSDLIDLLVERIQPWQFAKAFIDEAEARGDGTPAIIQRARNEIEEPLYQRARDAFQRYLSASR